MKKFILTLTALGVLAVQANKCDEGNIAGADAAKECWLDLCNCNDPEDGCDNVWIIDDECLIPLVKDEFADEPGDSPLDKMFNKCARRSVAKRLQKYKDICYGGDQCEEVGSAVGTYIADVFCDAKARHFSGKLPDKEVCIRIAISECETTVYNGIKSCDPDAGNSEIFDEMETCEKEVRDLVDRRLRRGRY